MSKSTELIAGRKEHIKLGLTQCSHAERVLFVKIYGPQEYLKDNFLFNVDKIAEHHLNDIVDRMPDSKLEWAASQVERTIQKKRDDDYTKDWQHRHRDLGTLTQIIPSKE